MQSREEMQRLKDENTDLVSENKILNLKVNMSNVQAVSDAREREYDALAKKRNAEYNAQQTIAKAEKKIAETEKQTALVKEKSLHRQSIAFGLVGLIMFVASFVHFGFWTELMEFANVPIDAMCETWIECIKTAPNGSELQRWLYLIFIPILFVGCFLGVAYLLVCIRSRWNMLTQAFIVFDLAVVVILCDNLPFNRIWLLLAFPVLYLVACSWIDKNIDYDKRKRWEKLQSELVWE